MENDINVEVFADLLCYLDPHPPVTEELDRWKPKHYKSEKAHMCGWFYSQTTKGTGSYTRSKPNNSAKTTYNRLATIGGMMWIAEALGETPERLKAAAGASGKDGLRKSCKGFREVITWERIYELLNHPENWRYDEKLLPIIETAEDGYPIFTDEDKFTEVVLEEMSENPQESRR